MGLFNPTMREEKVTQNNNYLYRYITRYDPNTVYRLCPIHLKATHGSKLLFVMY